ncbi:MAG: hypothetical protein HONBIEJF_00798 [Fimbriimonadaceae bacterium]|nr:hypothetical protein [Fimbriimonadaceae bacterium]
MSEIAKYRWRVFLYSAIPACLAPIIFTTISTGRFVPQFVLLGLCAGLPGAIGINVTEFFIMPKFRRRPFMLGVIARVLCYGAVMVPSFLLGLASFRAAMGGMDLSSQRLWQETWALFTMPAVQFGFWFALVGMFIANFLINFSHKVGPGVTLNWILGRYHSPRKERRFFMFLDLKDSTRLAEHLGNERFSLFVREFFEDMTYPLIKTQAEVSHYIGDEAVVSWRIDRGRRNQNCIQLYLLLLEEMDKRRDAYMNEFGELPRFKAGLHVGDVVATDVGGLKSEIVFHGDVMNTTARITGLCSELNHDFLVSAEAAEMLVGPVQFKDLGAFEVKGKAEKVRVCGVGLPEALDESSSERSGLRAAGPSTS